MSSKRRF